MNIGYRSDFMDRIIERADKRQERMEKTINKMLDQSEPILNAGKPKPMTNEEWFCTLSTEEKAKCLTNISFNTGYDSYNVVLKKMGEWLKQPHQQGVKK